MSPVLVDDDAQAADAEGQDLRVALLRLDLRLRLIVEAQRTELTERARDPFRGLYVSDADIDVALGDRRPTTWPSCCAPARLDRCRHDCGTWPISSTSTCSTRTPLLVCLAPDLDLRYERLYATCKMTSHGDVRSVDPRCACSAVARTAPGRRRSRRPGRTRG
jgi:hypothetical protein